MKEMFSALLTRYILLVLLILHYIVNTLQMQLISVSPKEFVEHFISGEQGIKWLIFFFRGNREHMEA